MSFLFENKLVLLLRPHDLLIFTKSGQPQELIFPLNVVSNQEIIDRKLFEKLLTDYFSRFSKQHAVLFLSHAVVFEKAVTREPQTDVDEEVKKFLETVPLPPTHIESKVIQTKERLFLFATNWDIYNTIVAIATQKGWHIKTVVPLVLFDEDIKGRKLSYALFSEILKRKNIFSQGNFLQKEKGETQEKTKIPASQYFMLVVCLLLLLGSLLFAAYTYRFFPFRGSIPSTKIKNISPTPKSLPSSTPTPLVRQENVLTKEAIKMQVLNGSGVTGQASALKEQLLTLGFSNVQIGNTDGPTSNATIVIFSESVPEDFRDEILSLLKKTFSFVDTQLLPSESIYDVSITTGELK